MRKVVGYARVSSHTQRDDPERQVRLIEEYARRKGCEVEVLKDIGSRLNEYRKNFNKLLEMVVNMEVSEVVVAYPDRLTRFGFKMLEKFFGSYEVKITVINQEREEPREKLAET